MHYAKSQMKKLKAEAKEVGALVAKNQKAAEQATELRPGYNSYNSCNIYDSYNRYDSCR